LKKMRNGRAGAGDLPPEMDRMSHLRFGFDPLALDEDTADRLLTGSLHPADAPPGYGDVARVVQAALVPVSLEGEQAAVEAMQMAMAESPASERRKNVLTKLLSAKAAAIVATGLISMTGAAAATGTLPEPVQHAADHIASTVGVDLPSSPDRPKVSDDTETPDASTGEADTGAPKTDSPATPAAVAPACPDGVENHGQAVSTVAHEKGDDHGAIVSAMAKSDCGKPEHSAPSSVPAAAPTSPTTEVHHSGHDGDRSSPSTTEVEHHDSTTTTLATEEHHDSPTTTVVSSEEHHGGDASTTTSTTAGSGDSGRK
jgi:hypothetical protein